MASRSALALAVMGLVGMSLSMQAAAQSATPAATKPSLKTAPAKPGSGMTANVAVNDGGGGNGSSTMQCSVGDDGRTICVPVVVSGSSSGGSGGDSFYLPIENPQGMPPIGGAAGGSGSAPSGDAAQRRLDAIKACHDEYKRNVQTVEDRFTHRTQSCIAKNGGGIGPITYGVIDDFLGVFGASCYDRAVEARDAERFNVNKANVDCLAKAQNA